MTKAVVNINGLIGDWGEEKGLKLTDVVAQVRAQQGYTEVELRIGDSIGGLVQEGFDIYNYIRSLKVPVTSIVEKYCASITSVIFLAGDVRLMNEGAKLMIHNPWNNPEGDADTLQEYVDELRGIEKQLAAVYDEHTAIGKDAIAVLMRNETEMSADEAVALGFATGKTGAQAPTGTTNKAVAYFKIKNMSKNKSIIEQLKGALAKLGGAVALTLQDAAGNEVVFETDAEQPAIGDKATVGGSPAEGEILMPDGSTFVFVAGELTEILEAGGGESTLTDEQMAAVRQVFKEELALAMKASNEANALVTEAIVNLSSKYEALARGVKSTFKVEQGGADPMAKNRKPDPVYEQYKQKTKGGK